ncbi:CHIT1 [Bugula neritina]|uniref:CHIT1 n=1 Tax=Bugula neritina TaxID=10212 RepID=A0A7J7KC10_BUGNE|nr:CHIT1 [Bugula neritina]
MSPAPTKTRLPTTGPPSNTTISPATTPTPSQCRPACLPSTQNKFLAHPCDPAKYYVCHRGTLWEGACANNTVFTESCSCCVHNI